MFNNRGVGGEELLVSTRKTGSVAYIPETGSTELYNIWSIEFRNVTYLLFCSRPCLSLSLHIDLCQFAILCNSVTVVLIHFVKPAKCSRQQGFSYDVGARKKYQNWHETEGAFSCCLHQTPVTYCAADTSDLERVVQHVKGLYADAPVLGAGVSLGGWVGEQLRILGKLVSPLHGFLF